MKKTEIKVSRTTMMFVMVLDQILRDKFKIKMASYPHWAFKTEDGVTYRGSGSAYILGTSYGGHFTVSITRKLEDFCGTDFVIWHFGVHAELPGCKKWTGTFNYQDFGEGKDRLDTKSRRLSIGRLYLSGAGFRRELRRGQELRDRHSHK